MRSPIVIAAMRHQCIGCAVIADTIGNWMSEREMMQMNTTLGSGKDVVDD